MIGDVVLPFVAQTAADQQIRFHSPVVLYIQAGVEDIYFPKRIPSRQKKLRRTESHRRDLRLRNTLRGEQLVLLIDVDRRITAELRKK